MAPEVQSVEFMWASFQQARKKGAKRSAATELFSNKNKVKTLPQFTM